MADALALRSLLAAMERGTALGCNTDGLDGACLTDLKAMERSTLVKHLRTCGISSLGHRYAIADAVMAYDLNAEPEVAIAQAAEEAEVKAAERQVQAEKESGRALRDAPASAPAADSARAPPYFLQRLFSALEPIVVEAAHAEEVMCTSGGDVGEDDELLPHDLQEQQEASPSPVSFPPLPLGTDPLGTDVAQAIHTTMCLETMQVPDDVADEVFHVAFRIGFPPLTHQAWDDIKPCERVFHNHGPPPRASGEPTPPGDVRGYLVNLSVFLGTG